MDRLNALHVFREVARCGSFAGAARHLGISRAGVTKHIAFLENALGARLLHRTSRQVGLTAAGLMALNGGRQLLERFEQLESDLRESSNTPRGAIRIGSPPAFGAHHLVPLIARFVDLHPDIQVSLFFDDGDLKLIEQGLDLSIRITPYLQDSSYIALPLTRAPQVLVAAPGYLSAHGTPKTPQDLEQHNCLVHSIKSPVGTWRFIGADGEMSVRVRGTIFSNLGEALRHAALLGHGISVHPYYMVSEDLSAGRLLPVLPGYVAEPLEIFVIYSSRQSLPQRVRRFIGFLQDWAANPPDWSLPSPSVRTRRRRSGARA